jgi:hypothetical protein
MFIRAIRGYPRFVFDLPHLPAAQKAKGDYLSMIAPLKARS